MSKIQPVTTNYQYKLNSNQNKTNLSSKPNFTGTTAANVNALNRAERVIFNKAFSKYAGSTLEYLGQTVGEKQTIVITGIGTACIAPPFVAFNPLPLSKRHDEETKKTKLYSSARLPISAIIATIFGFGINAPIERSLSNAVAKGTIEVFDMTATPPDNFLRRKYKKIIHKFGKLDKETQKYFDMVNDENKITTKEEFKKQFDFEIFKDEVHKKSAEVVAKKLLDPNNEKGLRNQTAKDFLVENLGFKVSIKDENVLNRDVVEFKLNRTTAMDFLRKLGFSENDVKESTLRAFISNNIYSERETVKLTTEERKTIMREIETMIDANSIDKEKISLKSLLKVLGIEDEFYKNSETLNQKMDKFLVKLDKKMDIKSAINASTTDPTKKIVEKIISEDELLEKFAKQLAKNTGNISGSKFKSYCKAQGIVLSLIVLPFSCGLLNWSYPKIMKKCFPSLIASKATSKDNKGGK